MTETVSLRGIPIEITRKQARALRITVHPDCRVTVTAPLSMPDEQVYGFLRARGDWIEKHRERYRTKKRKRPGAKNDFTDGEAYYIWGQPYQLEVTERRGNPKIVLEAADEGPGVMKMFVRPGAVKAQKQALLDKYKRRLVEEAAPPVIAKWEKALGKMAEEEGRRRKKPVIKIEKLYLMKMKTHWGSCNHTRRTIRLNTELAGRGPECLDYVVLHELVHLLVPSHNADFYRYMNALLPGWKEIRKKMNKGE